MCVQFFFSLSNGSKEKVNNGIRGNIRLSRRPKRGCKEGYVRNESVVNANLCTEKKSVKCNATLFFSPALSVCVCVVDSSLCRRAAHCPNDVRLVVCFRSRYANALFGLETEPTGKSRQWKSKCAGKNLREKERGGKGRKNKHRWRCNTDDGTPEEMTMIMRMHKNYTHSFYPSLPLSLQVNCSKQS